MKLLYLFLPSHKPVLEVWPVFSSLLSTCFAGLYPSLWLLLWCPEWTRLAACHRWLDWSTNTGVERVKSWDAEKVSEMSSKVKGNYDAFLRVIMIPADKNAPIRQFFYCRLYVISKTVDPATCKPHWELTNRQAPSQKKPVNTIFQLELYAALKTINLGSAVTRKNCLLKKRRLHVWRQRKWGECSMIKGGSWGHSAASSFSKHPHHFQWFCPSPLIIHEPHPPHIWGTTSACLKLLAWLEDSWRNYTLQQGCWPWWHQCEVLKTCVSLVSVFLSHFTTWF